MKKLLISTLSLGALAVSAGQAKASVFVIDTFNDGATFNTLAGTAPPDQTFTETVAAPGIFSGSRTVNHTLKQAETSFNTSTVFVNGDADVFALDNGSDVIGDAGASYDPESPVAIEPGGFFRFTIPFYDAPASDPAELALTVNGVTVEKSIPLGLTEFTFPISDFGTPASIDEISFLLTGPTGFDIQIDQLDYVVPEPMTILGTALALTALPGLKKAYNNKKA